MAAKHGQGQGNLARQAQTFAGSDCPKLIWPAEVVEQADTAVSKTAVRKDVGVRIPLSVSRF